MVSNATSNAGLPQVPLHAPLSAKYKDTFAFPTIKDRCPIILCKVIDHLHRQRNILNRELGPEAGEGLYKVVEQLSKLRYEMQTDKPITDIEDGNGNAEVWNNYLKSQKKLEDRPSWFSSAWLWVECYMYRRLLQSVNLTGVPKLLKFDFFRQQKEEGFHGSVASMEQLSSWLLPRLAELEDGNNKDQGNLSETFHILVQIALWGNKCDLSISAGSKAVATGDPVSSLESLSQFILSDQSLECWSRLLAKRKSSTISIVMDNCGFELFTDLCLADFLLASGLVDRVRLRIKDQPWFVSDTTQADLDWSMKQLLASPESAPLGQLARRWEARLRNKDWTVHSDAFWTFPHSYHEMPETDPALYQDLANDCLVIFKGDLNYRKLVGDLNWETSVTFPESLRDFRPSNVLAVRTAKADLMVGLEHGQAEEVAARDQTWMVTGQWGVIQFAANK